MSKKKHSLLIFHSLQDEDMHILVKGAFAVDPPTDNVRRGLGTAVPNKIEHVFGILWHQF